MALHLSGVLRFVADPEWRDGKGRNDPGFVTFRGVFNEKVGEKERATFVSGAASNGLGEFIHKYGRKGSRAFITGIGYIDEYETKEGGKGKDLKVQVRSLELIDWPDEEEGEQQGRGSRSTPARGSRGAGQREEPPEDDRGRRGGGTASRRTRTF